MSGVTLKEVAGILFKYTVFVLIVYLCITFPSATALLFVGYLIFSIVYVALSTPKDDNNVAN